MNRKGSEDEDEDCENWDHPEDQRQGQRWARVNNWVTEETEATETATMREEEDGGDHSLPSLVVHIRIGRGLVLPFGVQTGFFQLVLGFARDDTGPPHDRLKAILNRTTGRPHLREKREEDGEGRDGVRKEERR